MLGSLNVSDLGYLIVIILISMAAHEAMHAYVAHALGDTTAKDEGRLTLNPFAHVDLLTTILLPVVLIMMGLPPIFAARPVPFDPLRVRFGEYGAVLVALAGPFTNLGLAVVVSLIIKATMPAASALTNFLLMFVQVNIAFFVFNMIPLPPLDGSRLLYAFAPEPVQEVMYRIERAGFLVLMLVLLVLSPILFPVISNINQAIYSFLI